MSYFFTGLALGLAGGYVGAIYSWPWVRTFYKGVRNEIVELEDRAKSLRRKVGL
jgi:hypothetical protein